MFCHHSVHLFNSSNVNIKFLNYSVKNSVWNIFKYMPHALARWQYCIEYNRHCFDTNLKSNLAVWGPWQCSQVCCCVIWISSVESNEKVSSTATAQCSFRYFILCVLFQPRWMDAAFCPCPANQGASCCDRNTILCSNPCPPPHAHVCSHASTHRHKQVVLSLS